MLILSAGVELGIALGGFNHIAQAFVISLQYEQEM